MNYVSRWDQAAQSQRLGVENHAGPSLEALLAPLAKRLLDLVKGLGSPLHIIFPLAGIRPIEEVDPARLRQVRSMILRKG